MNPARNTLEPHDLFRSAVDNRSGHAGSRCEDRFAMPRTQYRLAGRDVASDRALRAHPIAFKPHESSWIAARAQERRAEPRSARRPDRLLGARQ
jgi:hypothetical protein